jgi:Protein of unknown function (DUF2585)
MTVTSDAPFEPVTPGRAPNRWGFALFVLAGLLTAHVVILWMMGRIWWCACGEADLIGHGGAHNSQHILDWYTPSHLLHGVFFYWLLLWPMKRGPYTTRIWVAVLIEIVWEIVENTPLVIDRYRAATTAVSYYGDSVTNSVADVIACIAGFELARRIGWIGSLLIFVFFELLTLWLIRDNLTLNVVMLLWPIDGIRTWQNG